MRRILPLALVCLAVGVVLGLLVGWGIWPVSYTNTVPAQLRQGERNDYVLMVAAAYQVEGDLREAERRLSLLDPDRPAQLAVDLAEQLMEGGGRPGDIAMLVRLADALGAATPVMIPYLEGQP